MKDSLVLYTAIQLILIAWGVYWWRSRRDEVPLLIAGFLLYCAAFRAWALRKGWAAPVDLGSAFLGPGNEASLLHALRLIILGELALLGAYCITQRRVLCISVSKLPEPQRLTLFRTVFPLALLIFSLTVVLRNYVGLRAEEGRSLAFEVSSYAFLFPMALVGLAILYLAMLRFGALTTTGQKMLVCAALAGVGWATFGPGLRFLFLGWTLAGAVIWSATIRESRNWVPLALGGAVGLALFGAAGTLRTEDPAQNLRKGAAQRLLSAEDANMLDGFVFLQQVYPALLPHSYGQEHLDILLRPIPRALWPGKPVGGYMNRLGLNPSSSGTVGISPTLFGTFFQEGGVYGIVLLAGLYGWALGRLQMWIASLPPFGSIVLRASLFAAIVPLLRAGDLPGVYAWIGMAFWPCVFVLYRIRQLRPEQAVASRALPTNSNRSPLQHEARPSVRELRPISSRSARQRRSTIARRRHRVAP